MNVSYWIKIFLEHFRKLPDCRLGKNKQYKIEEIASAAFSVFFMQSSSFLAHQKNLKKRKGDHNGRTLFGVSKIPSDNHIRQTLDTISPDELEPLFMEMFESLDKDEWCVDGRLLIAIDGITFFSSPTINCDCCLKKQCSNGKTSYTHAALCPVVVHPTQKAVFPLPPMFIQNSDGQEKQDCEVNAAKRWILKNQEFLSQHKVILLGDDLFSRDPMIKLIKSIPDVDCIFVAKPSSHPSIEPYRERLHESSKTKVEISDKAFASHVHKYDFSNKIPINGDVNCEDISYFHMEIYNKNNKKLYTNSFATTIPLTAKNIHTIACAGRNRWRIENEAFNVLATRGYHLKHNFGHGQKNLANFLTTLNILAFTVHNLCQLTDSLFQKVFTAFSSRKQFFQSIVTLTIFHLFTSWEELLEFMLESLE
jgi:hypothetical protein